MKIYEFAHSPTQPGRITRLREVDPVEAVTERVKQAARNSPDAGHNAAIGKLCEMIGMLITLLPADKADEILDYAYDIEE